MMIPHSELKQAKEYVAYLKGNMTISWRNLLNYVFHWEWLDYRWD